MFCQNSASIKTAPKRFPNTTFPFSFALGDSSARLSRLPLSRDYGHTLPFHPIPLLMWASRHCFCSAPPSKLHCIISIAMPGCGGLATTTMSPHALLKGFPPPQEKQCEGLGACSHACSCHILVLKLRFLKVIGSRWETVCVCWAVTTRRIFKR